MKFFLFLVLFGCSDLFPQEIDTLSQRRTTDTIKTLTDSSFVISRDTLSSDTTGIFSIQVDTLYPLYQNPFYNGSFFVNRRTIDMLDYRYSGNLFSPTGFSFLKDKGMIGQPNKLVLYGNSFGAIGFFSDGIRFNNRYTNLLDLNIIQSELIDSIEILPLPRGFLYGADSYIASVNFIEKDFITPAPYTRIKYYEGPEGEAFVDGIFNVSFLNKFNLSFDITNRNFDGIYTNSDFSIWQANVKLKYFLSNSINLIGSYYLVSSELGFFGGVDADSISKITNDINSVLYDPLQAPVVNPALRQEVNRDKFKIRTLGKFGSFYTDLNFYYHSEIEKYSGIPSKDEIKNYIWGALLRQSYSPTFLSIELNGVFEKRELNYYFIDTVSGFQTEKIEYNVLSVSPVFSLYLLDSIFIPSFFYKLTNYSNLNNSLHGFGGDVTVTVFNFLSLYGGISRFDFSNDMRINVYEVGAKIQYDKFISDVKFYRSEINHSVFIPLQNSFTSILLPTLQGNLSGFVASINFDFWKIGLEGKFNYNSFQKNQNPTDSEIKMYVNGGIYYKDILFNHNLDLKTGFDLKYYDFESENFKSAYQIDFTVAGIIQQAAIVYFSWENLFDEQYFIVPYYPMRERGIRFGIAWELFN
ncbi:MAG: hypothetical protein A2V93_08480 [Ignavibacteria bacterium RBG_16_34_14]|nr:MAG: hypothetical protein A2V93_08480 [Ignavibacteria bacterium RBG_16_34_14]